MSLEDHWGESVSVALNGQVTIAYINRRLAYRRVLSARSIETQLPIYCFCGQGGGGGGRQEKKKIVALLGFELVSFA